MKLRRNWRYYNDNRSRFSNLMTQDTKCLWGLSLEEKKTLLVVSAQTHTHTHTHTRAGHAKEEGVMIPKEKVKEWVLWIHIIKNISSENKKCSKQTDKLVCIFIIRSLRNRPYYFVTIHNSIDLTWFKSNQTGTISTSTFWEN